MKDGRFQLCALIGDIDAGRKDPTASRLLYFLLGRRFLEFRAGVPHRDAYFQRHMQDADSFLHHA